MSNKQTTAVQTAQAQETKPATTKSLFQQDNVQAKFKEILGTKAIGFMTSVLQCTAQNSLLAKAEPNTILQAAMVAATLDLPINNNLGFAYIIPYNEKVKGENGKPDTWRNVAQFQLGYKGFIQLAQRSGQFKTISATPIYEGQLIANNPLTGFEFDFTVAPNGEPVGYAAFFSLLNGFEKTLFMSRSELSTHGQKHSKTFKYGVWNNNFDAMALKTVTKLLLSKYAPLSIEMQKAVNSDQSIINNAETEDVTYIDNTAEEIDKENERFGLMVSDCTTKEELDKLKSHIDNDVKADLFNQHYNSL